MLYHIINPDYFDRCLENVKQAYWPNAEYLKQSGNLAYRNDIPGSGKEKIIEIRQKLHDIRKEVSGQELYKAIVDDRGNDKGLPFPFLRWFHKMFLVRQWEEPYNDPLARAKELFRLAPDNIGNYSHNYGNFNHFVNVVAALARLIMYFQDVDHIYRVFEDRSPEYDILVYERNPSLRTFKLMLAAFYHDIGKTVMDPRHAVEGAIILAQHTTRGRYNLDQIVKTYNSSGYEFDRDDFLFVADLVLYHDHYGTVGTGEDSYLPLVDVIDRIKRYSLKHEGDGISFFDWSLRYLFDLWLLNVADIMVSLERKYELQREWNDKGAEKWITAFFNKLQGGHLVHDFKITSVLLKEHCKKKHSDDLSHLEVAAHDCSERHVIERLRRLIISSLATSLSEFTDPDTSSDPSTQKIIKIARHIQNLSEGQWDATIVRSIRAVANYSEFTHRFSWIGKMDYALGFFQKLGKAALKKIQEELIGGPQTGWIIRKDGHIRSDLFLEQTQAQFFADNYVATLIQILAYLLSREPTTDRGRNIEFSDASSRLTEEKITQMLSLEGPARTHRSIQLILQTIYFY